MYTKIEHDTSFEQSTYYTTSLSRTLIKKELKCMYLLTYGILSALPREYFILQRQIETFLHIDTTFGTTLTAFRAPFLFWIPLSYVNYCIFDLELKSGSLLQWG